MYKTTIVFAVHIFIHVITLFQKSSIMRFFSGLYTTLYAVGKVWLFLLEVCLYHENEVSLGSSYR